MTTVHPSWVSPDDWVGLTIRIMLAALVGGAIGWNRHVSGKPAGLRTHMLVSLGAALFTLVPLQVSVASPSDAFSRAVQGVATGIGFLGAGEIVHESRKKGYTVRGLTSAAAIWVTAALGIVAACGLWQASVIGTLVTLLILTVAKWIERRVPVHDDEG